ncbi:MAG: acetyl-CoA C-acyltransferase [Brevundimonas sp.]|uniref:acetyl-CoA C-acyltransferase n=1 Tax=Brevundimonas sp. TaxID=1871086 RepID=UPI0025C62B44|nr:acetyl-CoA C-acyltransferase [Brevundimonas sp.]MBX3477728.1 acetyl-CoA C-acyltransferase [Brevundimonas sp.]
MTAYVIDAIRAPRGKGREGGGLNSLRPLDILGQLYGALGDRTGVDPGDVEEIVLGCVTQTGEQGGNIAQTSALHAGWGVRGSAFTVNSFCTSGLTACADVAAKIMAGVGDLYVAGGVECMSRVPMASDNGPLTTDREVMRTAPFIPNPIIADAIAAMEGFTRQDIDAYAVASHQKAAAATAQGRFVRSIIAIHGADGAVLLDRDEAIRPDASTEAMAGLKPLNDPERSARFLDRMRQDVPHLGDVAHIHHAGAAPAMVDGAALTLLASEEGARRLGRGVRARIRAWASTRGPAVLGLTGAIEAAQTALRRAGLTAADIDLWEANEGFAGVMLKVQRDLGIPPEKMNVNGGGIAMGHAMGATGVNLLGAIVDELERRDQTLGLIAISGAAGIGGALIVERCAL